MAAHVIVLANRTAAAPELIEALVHRVEKGPIHATLVMPAAGPGAAARADCKARLDVALDAWRAAGIERCDGVARRPLSHSSALARACDPPRSRCSSSLYLSSVEPRNQVRSNNGMVVMGCPTRRP